MADDVGVTSDLASGVKNRENGANPLRSRRCNRGRTPQIATASQVRGGKVRQVGRSGSQKTCPFVVSHSVFRGTKTLPSCAAVRPMTCVASRRMSQKVCRSSLGARSNPLAKSRSSGDR